MTTAILVLVIIIAFWSFMSTLALYSIWEKESKAISAHIDEAERHAVEMIYNMDKVKKDIEANGWTEC